MTKQVLTNAKVGESWKFRIVDITPFFKEVNSGIFTKIREDDNLYTCTEEYHDVVEGYISNGLLKLDVLEEPLRTSSKRYEIEDGRFMCYESKIQGNGIRKEYSRSITDNFYIVLDEDIEFDDGIEKIHRYKGRVIVDNGANEFKFVADAKSFVNPSDMGMVLADAGGAKIDFDNNQLKDIRIAMQRTSKYEMRKVSQVFGWQSKKVYQSQSSMIFPGVVRGGDSNVDLSDIAHARHLDIVAISNEEFKDVGNNIVEYLMNMHERYPIDCLLGFTFLAPIALKIAESEDWSGGNIGLWISGSSGCGKSYTSLLFQNFFGNFKNSKACLSWSSTPYSIQEDGYYFKDAICMVDDFKISNVSKNLDAAKSILQNYTDGTARTRLNINSNKRISEGKPIRGSLLITGEDLLDDVGSIMARYHIVSMDKNYINRPAGKNAYKCRNLYSGFMGRYIAWLLKDPKVVNKIVTKIEKQKDRFIGEHTSANIDRVAQSFAYNLVGFEMFCRFLEESGFILAKKRIEMIKIHKNNLFLHIDRNVLDAKDATVSEVFLNILKDLINSGSVKIHIVGVDKPMAYGDRGEYVGFDYLNKYIYFFGNPVWNAVNKAAGGLQNSKPSLLKELVERGFMKPGTQGNTYNQPLYGKSTTTWRILKSALGYEEEEVTEEEMEDW